MLGQGLTDGDRRTAGTETGGFPTFPPSWPCHLEHRKANRKEQKEVVRKPVCVSLALPNVTYHFKSFPGSGIRVPSPFRIHHEPRQEESLVCMFGTLIE